MGEYVSPQIKKHNSCSRITGILTLRFRETCHFFLDTFGRWRAWLWADFVSDIRVAERTDLVEEVDSPLSWQSRCRDLGRERWQVDIVKNPVVDSRHAKGLTNSDDTLKQTPDLLLLYYQYSNPVQSK